MGEEASGVRRGADCLVGLQYGSEGKGKVAAALAGFYDGAVRVGAPNAGHTIIYEGKPYKMRTIPCAWINPRCRLFIGPAGLLDVELLASEIASIPLTVVDRLRVDHNAGLISPEDKASEERGQEMWKFNGSTAEGVGVAQARKVRRISGIVAKDDERLRLYLGGVAEELNRMVDDGLSVMLEGTQGFGLSLNHGHYPFVTSRDVLASSLLSECGLAPQTHRFTFGVLRRYPIRVAGNSGPLKNEISWEEVATRSGYAGLSERTTVTNRVRRVGEIDWEMLHYSCLLNRPDGLFITFIDYCNSRNRGVRSFQNLTKEALEFVYEVEDRLQRPVVGVSTGPETEDMAWTEHWLAFYDNLAKREGQPKLPLPV